MSTFHLHDASGVFTGASISCPDQFVRANVPAGLYAFEGDVDPSRQCLAWITDDMGNTVGVLSEYRPPEPDATDLIRWVWDEARWRWVDVPTDLALDLAARRDRDARLLASDWTDTASAPDRLGPEIYAAWQAYRQALRDMPAAPGWPLTHETPPVPTP